MSTENGYDQLAARIASRLATSQVHAGLHQELAGAAADHADRLNTELRAERDQLGRALEQVTAFYNEAITSMQAAVIDQEQDGDGMHWITKYLIEHKRDPRASLYTWDGSEKVGEWHARHSAAAEILRRFHETPEDVEASAEMKERGSVL